MASNPAAARRPGHARTGTVSALKRGIALLCCFEEHPGPLSNGEIARLTGIPKPTVTRLVATLVALGFLRQAPGTEKVGLGAGVMTLAQVYLSGLDVRAQARPHMMELAEAIGGWSYLAARNRLEMVLVETCRSRSAVLRSRLDVGSRVPMANSALGRAYLSALGPRDQDALLEQIRLENPRAWPRLRAGLKRALKEAATRGYCVSAGEWHPDVNSMAVPLLVPGGELMALNCGGPAFAFPPQRLRAEIAPRLLATAAAIAREIGGQAVNAEPGRRPARRVRSRRVR